MDEQNPLVGCGCGLLSLGFLVLVYFIGGQWRTEITYVPQLADNVSNIQQFEETLNGRHWVGGLVQGEQPDLQQAINKHLGNGKQLTKLTVRTKHSLLDNFLMVITLFIYSPVTVVVNGSVGDVVQAQIQPPAAPMGAQPAATPAKSGR
ncbi:MAG: hypothetical protein AB7U82_13475 [Blastocatellales bacterium]